MDHETMLARIEAVIELVLESPRDVRAAAIVNAIRFTAEKDTFQALANEIAEFKIDDMADWLRALADALDAA